MNNSLIIQNMGLNFKQKALAIKKMECDLFSVISDFIPLLGINEFISFDPEKTTNIDGVFKFERNEFKKITSCYYALNICRDYQNKYKCLVFNILIDKEKNLSLQTYSDIIYNYYKINENYVKLEVIIFEKHIQTDKPNILCQEQINCIQQLEVYVKNLVNIFVAKQLNCIPHIRKLFIKDTDYIYNYFYLILIQEFNFQSDTNQALKLHENQALKSYANLNKFSKLYKNQTSNTNLNQTSNIDITILQRCRQFIKNKDLPIDETTINLINNTIYQLNKLSKTTISNIFYEFKNSLRSEDPENIYISTSELNKNPNVLQINSFDSNTLKNIIKALLSRKNIYNFIIKNNLEKSFTNQSNQIYPSLPCQIYADPFIHRQISVTQPDQIFTTQIYPSLNQITQSDQIYPAQFNEIYPAQSNEISPSQSNEISADEPYQIYPAQSNEIYPAQSNEIYPAQSNEIYPAQSNEISADEPYQVIYDISLNTQKKNKIRSFSQIVDYFSKKNKSNEIPVDPNYQVIYDISLNKPEKGKSKFFKK